MPKVRRKLGEAQVSQFFPCVSLLQYKPLLQEEEFCTDKGNKLDKGNSWLVGGKGNKKDSPSGSSVNSSELEDPEASKETKNKQ